MSAERVLRGHTFILFIYCDLDSGPRSLSSAFSHTYPKQRLQFNRSLQPSAAEVILG